MSHKLVGKNVDDAIIEFWGPHNGRNYFSTATPQLRIQLFGADAATDLQVEENTTLVLKGTNNSNAMGSQPANDVYSHEVRGAKIDVEREAGTVWAPLGGLIDVAAGLVVIALTARDDPYVIRVRIDALGATLPVPGEVEIATEWN